jgi:tetratricopeptide (TPR) repeat protein
VLENGRYVLSAPMDAAGLPSSIRDVVGRRVERLGDEPARVLTAASIIGREFDLGVLADVTETPEDDLLDLLDDMVSASLVVEHPDVPGMYRFEHALIQHTLYQDLGTTRRQRMHQRVAEALERAGATSTRPAAELARHWLAATRPTDVNKALEYVREAGQEALAALAPDDAMSWFTQGLELADRSGVDDELRCDLLLGLGNAQRDAGKPEHRETLLAAAALAQDVGDPDRLAAAALGNCRVADVMVVDPERISMLEAALAVTPESDRARRSQLLAALAAQIDGREWERRRDLSLEALALTEAEGDDALRLTILNRIGLNIGLPELLDERLERAHEGIRLADAFQDPVQQVQARVNALQPFMESGDRATADRTFTELEELAEKTRLPFHQWQVGIIRTAMLIMRADLEAAEASNDAVLELGLATGQPEAFGVYGGVLFVLRDTQGRLDEVAEVIEQAARDVPQIDALRPALAYTWSQLGDLDRAREWYERDASTQFRDLTPSSQWLASMGTAANAAIVLGDRDGAETLMELLVPYRSRLIYTGGTIAGSPALTLGQLATFLERYDDAPGFFVEAHAIFRRFDAPYFAALTDLEEAMFLSRRGDHGDADQSRDIAATVRELSRARGFGMLERRAEALLAALG